MRLGWLVGSLAFSIATIAAAEDAVDAARKLQAEGRGSEARDLLSRAAEADPSNEVYVLARADSYLAEGNEFWALRVLQGFSDEHPPACQALAFMARIHIDQANLDQAEEILDRPGCDRPEDRARRLVLRAVIAEARGDRAAARAAVERAREQSPRYAEDDALIDALGDPGRLPWVSWNLDLAAGITSNGLAGSPVDVAVPRSEGSAIVTTDARLRLVIPTGIAIRPSLEVQPRLVQLFGSEASELSSRQIGLRTGALIGTSHPRLLVAYGYEITQIQGGDRYDPGPLVYSEAHRAEYEFEATDRLLTFGGGGYRAFREAGRSRAELEQGLAAVMAPWPSLRVLSGLSMRFLQASNSAYDAVGATAIARVSLAALDGWEIRGTLSLSGDLYPDSAGYFAESDRVDLLVRTGPGVYTPSVSGARLGIDYEYTRRKSTAPAYEFSDHRVLLHLVWRSDSDRIGAAPVAARVLMRHGGSKAKAGSGSEIRDLMRQDESVRRGSSCLK